jgi:pSer/pThr/pTyr-binding forkhead associated (FHA) protein
MPKLYLKHEGVTLNTYNLEKKITTIGRKSDNDIQINDAAASSHHVQVIIKPNEYMEEQIDARLEDVGSTNGTLVNGCLVKAVDLRNGDDIQIGNHHFIYENDDTVGMDSTAIFLPDED